MLKKPMKMDLETLIGDYTREEVFQWIREYESYNNKEIIKFREDIVGMIEKTCDDGSMTTNLRDFLTLRVYEINHEQEVENETN